MPFLLTTGMQCIFRITSHGQTWIKYKKINYSTVFVRFSEACLIYLYESAPCTLFCWLIAARELNQVDPMYLTRVFGPGLRQNSLYATLFFAQWLTLSMCNI